MMGRLFWKIFLGFWLTLTISGGLVGTIVWQNNKTRIQDFDKLKGSTKDTYSLNLVARIMSTGGISFLQQFGDTNSFPVLIIDESDIELLGRTLPYNGVDSKLTYLANLDQNMSIDVQTEKGRYLLISSPLHKFGATIRFNDRPNKVWRLLGLLIFLVGGMLFSIALTLYITSPIKSLRMATNRFAEGLLDTRITSKFQKRKDEIAGLASDFNLMAEKIQLLLMAQQNLVNDVSHELRSPLSRLKLTLELISQQPDDIDELLARVDKECNRFEYLIDGFLTLAKTEIQILDNSDHFDINGLIDNISSDAQFEANKRSIKVCFSNKEEILIDGNLEMLHRAIENIIRNAVYYSPEHSEIFIVTKRQDKGVCLTVCDKGGGVEEDRLPDLFQPFFRVKDELQNANTPGYGLGLAIAHRAINSHSGRITALNQDGGLCVKVLLPISSTS